MLLLLLVVFRLSPPPFVTFKDMVEARYYTHTLSIIACLLLDILKVVVSSLLVDHTA